MRRRTNTGGRDDASARECARWFYAGVLGLSAPDDKASVIGTAPPATIGYALRDARRKAFAFKPASSTWGAYQHYGDPYLRFFDPDVLRGAAPSEGEGEEEEAESRPRDTMMPPPPE